MTLITKNKTGHPGRSRRVLANTNKQTNKQTTNNKQQTTNNEQQTKNSTMQSLETEQQLAKAFWDIAVDPGELCQLLVGDTERVGHITRERLYRRLMETFSWYQILEIVPADQIKNMLDENNISRLRDKTLQKRYEILAEILRTTALSASG